MKNKYVAGILAILLGDLGIHKFYLGKIGWGIVYLLFCWTGIPAIVGLIEGIIYLCTDEETFQVKYCGMPPSVAVNKTQAIIIRLKILVRKKFILMMTQI